MLNTVLEDDSANTVAASAREFSLGLPPREDLPAR
jgi:hypothetical protein